jgi:hypothetical protein
MKPKVELSFCVPGGNWFETAQWAEALQAI